MNKITKPMLACSVESMDAIKFPVLGTQKLDGIRCLIMDGQAVSRNFKLIPNRYIQDQLHQMELPDGLDGELILEGKEFNEVASAVMSVSGEPDFRYYVFDYVSGELDKPYNERMDELEKLELPDFCVKLLPVELTSLSALLSYENKCVKKGFEGIMIRTASSPYKCGRSTAREGYLQKIKRFTDSEAEILDFEEREHNANEAMKDELGRTKRSSHQENMIKTGTLGALQVRDIKTKVEFKIGTGFDDVLRQEIWDHRKKYSKLLVKYKFQAAGALIAPRFPVFIGFRDSNDLS
jgi:DNA ligase-1